MKTDFHLTQNQYTLLFMAVLSLVCALILSTLASALKEPQEIAKELDRSKQMLIAAHILSPKGYFLVEEKGEFIPADWKQGQLVATRQVRIASQEQILDVVRARIVPFLVNAQGEEKSFAQVGQEEKKYTEEYRRTGYYRQPWKLVYAVMGNGEASKKKIGYIIPVNGMGLWDAIYGFIALEADGNRVMGISWYDQKETPGLGANIAEADWQSQFPGKQVFQAGPDGKVDANTALLGIVVVKGKVQEVLGNTPKALSSVDGMSGATLTGNGVTEAYKTVLQAYRPFLFKLYGVGKAKHE